MAKKTAEDKERESLEDELISKVNKPKEKTYRGCVRRGSDKNKVAKLKELRIKRAKEEKEKIKEKDGN